MQMTPLKLYSLDRSPPCRAVLLTAKALGVEINEIQVDYFKQETLTPEYEKLNPHHTVPTLLDENGRSMCDSHAIMPYLIAKYARDDALYPRDPYKRALIDHRLHFDSGTFWPLIINLIKSIIRGIIKEIPTDTHKTAYEQYNVIETFLEGHEWVAGDSVSLADFSLYTSAECLNVLIPYDPKIFPNINAWFKKVQTLPYFDVVKPGHQAFMKFISQFWNI